MYINNKEQLDKFKFHHQFPFHATCSPVTLNHSEGVMAHTPMSKSVLVPVSPSPTYRSEVETFTEQKVEDPFLSTSSSWWTWTFSVVTAPLLFWGFPFYLLTTSPPTSYHPQIRGPGMWLKRVFDCTSNPFTFILTAILLILTALLNIYVLYIFGNLFNNLFILGVYEASMFQDVIDFVRDVPILIALDHAWLFGFRINNVITVLNQKHRKYQRHVSCTSFRVRVVLMIVVIGVLHTIRFFSFKKYSSFYAENLDILVVADEAWEFATDIFLSLLLPLYCTFCYAVRFELFIIKSIIYELISRRVKPTIAHLDKFKTLFTHAADHIDAINNLFSLYLSLTIGMIIVGTVMDVQRLLTTMGEAALNGIIGVFFQHGGKMPKMLKKIFGDGDGGSNLPPTFPQAPDGVTDGAAGAAANETLGSLLTPAEVRQLNADIVYVLAVYGLIIYTVWQAVGTNDFVREIHVWLNDFVAGAGGTDVQGMLNNVGARDQTGTRTGGERKRNVTERQDYLGVDSQRLPLIWAENKLLRDGENDQFLEKFNMLKAYIHVRMQLEKSSLLNIVLVGLFVPTLSGRLKAYNVIF